MPSNVHYTTLGRSSAGINIPDLLIPSSSHQHLPRSTILHAPTLPTSLDSHLHFQASKLRSCVPKLHGSLRAFLFPQRQDTSGATGYLLIASSPPPSLLLLLLLLLQLLHRRYTHTMDPIESGRRADHRGEQEPKPPLPMNDPYPAPLLSYDDSYGNFHESRLRNLVQSDVDESRAPSVERSNFHESRLRNLVQSNVGESQAQEIERSNVGENRAQDIAPSNFLESQLRNLVQPDVGESRTQGIAPSNFHESRLQNITQYNVGGPNVGGNPVERYLPPLGFYYDPADDAIAIQLPVCIEEHNKPNAHCGRCLKPVREHPRNENSIRNCKGRCGFCGQKHPKGATCPQLYATHTWLKDRLKGTSAGLQIRPSPSDEEHLKRGGYIHPRAQHRWGLLPEFTAAAWATRPTSDNRSVRANAIFNPSDTRSHEGVRPNHNPAAEKEIRELRKSLTDMRKRITDAEQSVKAISDAYKQPANTQTQYMNRQDHMFGSPATSQQSTFQPHLRHGNTPTNASPWLSSLHESSLRTSTSGQSLMDHAMTDDLRAMEDHENVRRAFRDRNRAQSNAQRASAANVQHRKSILNYITRDNSSAAQDRGRRGGSVSRSPGPSSGLLNSYPVTEGMGDAHRKDDVHDHPFIKEEPTD